MKAKIFSLFASTATCVFAASAFATGFTVHEWGTFTSVSGSDGVLLPGLEVEEAPLPNFVQSLDRLPRPPRACRVR